MHITCKHYYLHQKLVQQQQQHHKKLSCSKNLKIKRHNFRHIFFPRYFSLSLYRNFSEKTHLRVYEPRTLKERFEHTIPFENSWYTLGDIISDDVVIPLFHGFIAFSLVIFITSVCRLLFAPLKRLSLLKLYNFLQHTYIYTQCLLYTLIIIKWYKYTWKSYMNKWRMLTKVGQAMRVNMIMFWVFHSTLVCTVLVYYRHIEAHTRDFIWKDV